MPRATDGNSRKKHIIRESSRRLRAANNFPIQLELDWNAAQKVNAPKPRTQDEPSDVQKAVDGDVVGRCGKLEAKPRHQSVEIRSNKLLLWTKDEFCLFKSYQKHVICTVVPYAVTER